MTFLGGPPPVPFVDDDFDGPNLAECDYYQGVGSCTFGCWEEPACITDRPSGGWPLIVRPPYEEMLLVSRRLQYRTSRWLAWRHLMILLGPSNTGPPVPSANSEEADIVTTVPARGGRHPMTTTDPEIQSVTDGLAELLGGVDDLCGLYRMIGERQPTLQPLLAQSLATFRDQLVILFQPYVDLADGTISFAEFDRIQAARTAADEQERLAKWDGYRIDDDDEDGAPIWLVPCCSCGVDIELEVLPPLAPRCERCRAEEAEERAALEATDGD